MASQPVLETIGKPTVHVPSYASGDWHQRENFTTIEHAREYAAFKSRQYPLTPYRIRELRGRFVVEYVPEWKLQS